MNNAKRRIIISYLAAVMLSTTVLATGCSDGNILDIGGGNDDAVAAEVSTDISIPIEKFRTLNPVLTRDKDVYFMEKLVYESLVELDETLVPQPSIASDWSFSDDGMTLSFNIRSDIYWHDGDRLTAKDVKFTIDTLLKAQYSGHSLYDANIANIKSVKTEGSSVIVSFRTPSDNCVENFVFPIIPEHQFRSINDVFKQNEDFIPIGTGPYFVSEYDSVKRVVLEANDKYFGDKKAENRLIFKIIPNIDDAVNLFDINDLMITYSQATDRDKIFSGLDVNIYPFVSNEVEVLGFNCSKPAFSDRRVRQAIACSIDTQSIIENAYYNNAIRNDNIYYPNYLGKNSSEKLIGQSYDKAQKLLAESGYINRDDDIYVENSSGAEIEIGILINSGDASRQTAADLIKNSLDKLPIHSYIIVKDWSGYTADLNSGNYDVFIGGWKVESDYDMGFALHSGSNPARYANTEMDALLDKMKSGIDAETKLETFTRIKEIYNEDLPYFCLAYKTYAAVTAKSMKGIVKPYFFDIYRTSEDWKYEY